MVGEAMAHVQGSGLGHCGRLRAAYELPGYMYAFIAFRCKSTFTSLPCIGVTVNRATSNLMD